MSENQGFVIQGKAVLGDAQENKLLNIGEAVLVKGNQVKGMGFGFRYHPEKPVHVSSPEWGMAIVEGLPDYWGRFSAARDEEGNLDINFFPEIDLVATIFDPEGKPRGHSFFLERGEANVFVIPKRASGIRFGFPHVSAEKLKMLSDGQVATILPQLKEHGGTFFDLVKLDQLPQTLEGSLPAAGIFQRDLDTDEIRPISREEILAEVTRLRTKEDGVVSTGVEGTDVIG